MRCQSKGLTEAARTRMSISSSPAVGVSSSSHRRTSGGPYARYTTAFILRNLRRLAPQRLLEVRPHDLDEIGGGVLGRRCFLSRHMTEDMIFHQLRHQAVNRAASGRQPLQDVDARGIGSEGPFDGGQLAADF